MEFIKDMAKGILIGIANVIPGVSGGSMAVSLGIYQKLITALSDFFKNWKKSGKIMLPIFLDSVYARCTKGQGYGIIYATREVAYGKLAEPT